MVFASLVVCLNLGVWQHVQKMGLSWTPNSLVFPLDHSCNYVMSPLSSCNETLAHQSDCLVLIDDVLVSHLDSMAVAGLTGMHDVPNRTF